MYRPRTLSLSLFVFCISLNTVLAQELNAEQIYAKINDAVVTIYTFDAAGKILSQGSGVVLNEKGWIVTNYHVYAGAEKLVVKHKERKIEYSSIIGLDVEKDILILKIADHTFPPIPVGNSDLLKVGQKIYAIGSPMGLENTISEGIISGLRAYEERTRNFIQVSAAISPGSSGGAVVNAKGELIAITTLTITKGQNLNFAIPINEVLEVYKDVGVSPKDLSSALYFYKGNTEYEQNNYDVAIDNYKKAIDINPELSEAYYNLGVAYSKKEEIETAVTYYEKAIAIDPEFTEAYYGLGFLYFKGGEFQTAIIYYKKAIAIDSEFIEVYINLANVYSIKGEIETAISYLKEAIVINPEYADAYINLGNAYSEKGDINASIASYKKAIEIEPENSDAYVNLGMSYSDKGDIEAAISSYKKAIDINSENGNGYRCLGDAYLISDIETAIMFYKKAIFLNPNDSISYFNLGIAFGKKGDKNLKKYYLEKAFQLDPSLKNK